MSKDELMDEELAGMVNSTDETVPGGIPGMERERTIPQSPAATAPFTQGSRKGCGEGPGQAVPVAEYVPVKVQRGLVDRLYSCVMWLGVCGSIAMLLWWFWQNDLMAMEAAYPCILACGVIGAFGAGINMAR